MKTLNLICEAKLNLSEKATNGQPTGLIEARVTTFGPREGADGRKFFYKPEGFMQWAKEFAEMGRPLPMYVNDLKVLEEALRDAGLSKSDAVAAASTFKKVLEQRDAETVAIENAPQQSDSGAEATEAEILAALEQRELLKLLDKRLKG